MTLRLSKLHGLGNDFLVHLSDDAAVLNDPDVWSRRAVDWCRRTRGIGADGFIVGVRGQPGSDLVLVLHNADGSRAEMSGNGIRCLAHAEARRRGELTGRLTIATDAGLRTVDHQPDPGGSAATVFASVDMGPGRPGPKPDRTPQLPCLTGKPSEREVVELALAPRRTATYDVGNPHLVLLVDDPGLVDVARAGPGHEAGYDGGINVHFVGPHRHEPDAISVVTWERGAGITEACGTGASASALAAHQWGLVGQQVSVHVPGGDVTVDVGERLVLHGPSVHIADVEVAL